MWRHIKYKCRCRVYNVLYNLRVQRSLQRSCCLYHVQDLGKIGGKKSQKDLCLYSLIPHIPLCLWQLCFPVFCPKAILIEWQNCWLLDVEIVPGMLSTRRVLQNSEGYKSSIAKACLLQGFMHYSYLFVFLWSTTNVWSVCNIFKIVLNCSVM